MKEDEARFHGVARTLHALFIPRECGRALAVNGRIGNELLIYLSSLARTLVGERWGKGAGRGGKVAPSRPSGVKRNCSAYRARISFDRKNGLKVLASLFAQLLSAPRVQLAN